MATLLLQQTGDWHSNKATQITEVTSFIHYDRKQETQLSQKDCVVLLLRKPYKLSNVTILN